MYILLYTSLSAIALIRFFSACFLPVIFSTIILSSFCLLRKLCILLPAYLCYALQLLYNYISLLQFYSLCRYSSYTDVYLYLSAFPDSQLFFVTDAPFSSGRCRREFYVDWLFVIQCQLVLFFIFFFYLPELLFVPQYYLLVPPFFYLLCCV